MYLQIENFYDCLLWHFVIERAKVHSNLAKVEAVAKNFFDVCHVFFDHFSLSFGVNGPLTWVEIDLHGIYVDSLSGLISNL